MITTFNTMRASLRSPPAPSLRAAIIAALSAALVLAVAGCSAVKLGYGQAGTFAYRWLDGYVDFSEAQKARVRPALDDFFAWHRRTQLPDYAEMLAQAQGELLGEVTPQRMCAVAGEVRNRLDTAFERALPTIAEMVPTLTVQQIANIEKRYAEKNEEYRDEFVQRDLAKRRRAAIKREVERAESFYGSVDDAQREFIVRSLAASPFDAEISYAERLQRQNEALALLRRLSAAPPGSGEAAAQIRAYVKHLERSPREAYRQYSERLVDYNCAFASALHNQTTATQRRAAVKKLKGYESDLRELAADSPG